MKKVECYLSLAKNLSSDLDLFTPLKPLSEPPFTDLHRSHLALPGTLPSFRDISSSEQFESEDLTLDDKR